jgi:hypothetical protein
VEGASKAKACIGGSLPLHAILPNKAHVFVCLSLQCDHLTRLALLTRHQYLQQKAFKSNPKTSRLLEDDNDSRQLLSLIKVHQPFSSVLHCLFCVLSSRLCLLALVFSAPLVESVPFQPFVDFKLMYLVCIYVFFRCFIYAYPYIGPLVQRTNISRAVSVDSDSQSSSSAPLENSNSASNKKMKLSRQNSASVPLSRQGSFLTRTLSFGSHSGTGKKEAEKKMSGSSSSRSSMQKTVSSRTFVFMNDDSNSRFSMTGDESQSQTAFNISSSKSDSNSSSRPALEKNGGSRFSGRSPMPPRSSSMSSVGSKLFERDGMAMASFLLTSHPCALSYVLPRLILYLCLLCLSTLPVLFSLDTVGLLSVMATNHFKRGIKKNITR